MPRWMQIALWPRCHSKSDAGIELAATAPLLARIRDLEAQLANAYNERLVVGERLHDELEKSKKLKVEMMYWAEELEMLCQDILG